MPIKQGGMFANRARIWLRVHLWRTTIAPGCLHYQLMPTMPETRLRPLMEKFVELMREQPLLVNIYGLV